MAAEHLPNLAQNSRLAAQVAEMSIIRPEVLRVTPAYKALQKCGEAFRLTRDLYHESEQSEEISSFWSHSWHGNSWKKMLTLMVLYNGLPSLCSCGRRAGPFLNVELGDWLLCCPCDLRLVETTARSLL